MKTTDTIHARLCDIHAAVKALQERPTRPDKGQAANDIARARLALWDAFRTLREEAVKASTSDKERAYFETLEVDRGL